MRTVTFADPTLRRLLKKEFVCTWKNTTGDASAGASFAHDPKEPAPSCARGNGEHNVQMMVLTHEGKLLFVRAGYLDAKDMLEDLRFARKLKGKSKEEVAQAHRKERARLEEVEFKGPLASFAKRRALRDHQFVAKRPLLPVNEFVPTDLVGHGKAFFGSRNGSTKATAHMGELPESIKKKLKEKPSENADKD